MLKTAVLTLTLIAISNFAAANTSSQCSLGEISRNIDIVYSHPGQPVPCEVLYDKRSEGGGLATLWRAQNEAGYCEARAAEFIARLEAMGYTCGAAKEGNQPSSTAAVNAAEQN